MGWEGKNPTHNIEKNPEKARERYLCSEEEYKRFSDAIETENNPTMRDAILMLLYTAARKNNVLSMEWNEINLTDATWYIPAAKSKNRKFQRIPLIDEAMQILQARYKQRNSKWVFPSDHNSKSGHVEDPRKALNRLRKKADLKDFRLHDLSRTRASWMAITGASLLLIGKALNHENPVSTLVYSRLDTESVRESMQKASNVFKKKVTDNTEALYKKKIEELEQQIIDLKRTQG